MEKMLSVLEFALKAKVSPSSAYKMAKNGTIRCQKIRKGMRKTMHIPKSEVDKFLKS